MKSYTDIEQSKRLAEILPIKSADMDYIPVVNIDGEYSIVVNIWDNDHVIEEGWIPCWSLAALMNVLDRGALFITPQGWACQSYINLKAITSDHHSNPIDACYEIILRLHELKIL